MTFSLSANTELELGDHCAIQKGVNQQSLLWCEVAKMIGNIAHCFVINGAWTIDVDTTTGKTMDPYLGGQICWIGKAPFDHLDYNEAIEWIAKQPKL